MSGALDHLTPAQVQMLIERIPELPLAEKLHLLEELEAYDVKNARRRAREDFLVFCHRIYPGFKEGPHHRHLRPLLHDMAKADWASQGTQAPPHALRLTVSMPPRFGKSESIAFLYVAWYLGHNPSHQVMMITHTEELSAGFGRKVRDLIDTPEYQEIFEGAVQVSKDKSASGNWTTVQKGVYLALGVGGSAAGKGADLLVADDLVSEQAVLYGNPETAFEHAWNYMQVGPLQRLMPGGRIIMIGTRWGKRDPIGRALKWSQDNPESLPWHEVRFPAVINGKSLWPEQWPVEQLMAKKAGMLPQFWQAQYMQEPTAEEGALIKREYWKIWPLDKEPPEVEFVLQVWDTAHEIKTRNDYSACQTWGVWHNSQTHRNELILLNGFHKRMEFPDLKTRAKAEFDAWDPDELIIEKKAAGAPLIQELRQMDIAVTAVSPSRGARGMSNDKYARVNAISAIFKDGVVWAPDTLWAREIIELCAAFPNGEFDDPVDCLVAGTQVLMADGTTRAIEHIRIGDMVHTPRGARKVTAAGFTGRHPTVQLRVGGVVLEGTYNHPVATSRGWVPMDKLQIVDTIKMTSTSRNRQWISSLCVWAKQKSSNFWAASTVGTQSRLEVHTAGISTKPVAEDCCIATYGPTATAQFRTGTTYTTATETTSTTRQGIWSWWSELHTKKNTQKAVVERALTHSGSTWKTYVNWLQSGTAAPRAENGTPRTQQKTLLLVGLRTLRYGLHGKKEERTHIVAYAQSVVRTLRRRWQQRSFVATRASIETVVLSESRKPVFNISVEGEQCYYANGVLVHNCVEMAVSRYRRGGFLRLSDDSTEDDNPPLPRARAYY